MGGKIKYFTVGELAKKINVSVRTIQYYDQIGLLSPSGYTEGGRRLYTMKDYVTLYQIISLKEFGFSLSEIKERLMPADSIEEINEYLTDQESKIQTEIKMLEIKYELIHKFRKELNKIRKIDWELFVEILSLLRNNDEHYWIVKYFDRDVFERIKEKHTKERGKRYLAEMEKLCDTALDLQNKEISWDSEEAIELARAWWQKVMDFTGGDMEMLQQLLNISSDEDPTNTALMKEFNIAREYITNALTTYFEKLGIENINEIGGDSDD